MNQKYIELAIKDVAKELGQSPGNMKSCYESNSGWPPPLFSPEGTISEFRKLLMYAVNQRAIVLQVDDVLTVNWISVKDDDYRDALNRLVCFGIQTDKDLERLNNV